MKNESDRHFSTFGAFTVLPMVFAIAETLATVTKGRVPSVLVIMMLMLIRFLQSKFIKTHPGPELSPLKSFYQKL